MRILIAHNVARLALAWRDAITTRLPQSTVVTWPEALDDLADYAIGWRPPEALFQRERRLKAFFVAGAGVDQVLTIRSLDPRLPIIRLEDAAWADRSLSTVFTRCLTGTPNGMPMTACSRTESGSPYRSQLRPNGR